MDAAYMDAFIGAQPFRELDERWIVTMRDVLHGYAWRSYSPIVIFKKELAAL